MSVAGAGLHRQEQLEELIMGNGVKPVDLKQAVNNLDALPAMPVIAQKLLALKLDTEEGERTMLVLVGNDPQISAKIVGLSNAAAAGATRHIASVKDAAMLLGMDRVGSVATGIAIMSTMSRINTGRLSMQDLWIHSFGIAFAMLGIARFMPKETRPQDDRIFLAGMLHDIGYLALSFLDPKQSDKLHVRLLAEMSRPALEIEKEILEICHDELGALLASHWNLPDEIIAVLRYHHRPDAAGDAVAQPLPHMINIAEKLLPSFGLNEYVAPGISDEEWKALGIDLSLVRDVEEQVAEQAAQAAQFAGLFA